MNPIARNTTNLDSKPYRRIRNESTGGAGVGGTGGTPGHAVEESGEESPTGSSPPTRIRQRRWRSGGGEYSSSSSGSSSSGTKRIGNHRRLKAPSSGGKLPTTMMFERNSDSSASVSSRSSTEEKRRKKREIEQLVQRSKAKASTAGFRKSGATLKKAVLPPQSYDDSGVAYRQHNKLYSASTANPLSYKAEIARLASVRKPQPKSPPSFAQQKQPITMDDNETVGDHTAATATSTLASGSVVSAASNRSEGEMLKLAYEMSMQSLKEEQLHSTSSKGDHRVTEQAEEEEEEQQVRHSLEHSYRQSSTRSILSSSASGELTELIPTDSTDRPFERVRNVTLGVSTSSSSSSDNTVIRQIEAARQHLSVKEAAEIERALRDAGEVVPPPTPSPSLSSAETISEREKEEIEKAIREADQLENERSFSLALELQTEEAGRIKPGSAGLPPAVFETRSSGGIPATVLETGRSSGSHLPTVVESQPRVVDTSSFVVQDRNAQEVTNPNGPNAANLFHQRPGSALPSLVEGATFLAGSTMPAMNFDNFLHSAAETRFSSNNIDDTATFRSDPTMMTFASLPSIATFRSDPLAGMSQGLEFEADEDIAFVGSKAFNAFSRSKQKTTAASPSAPAPLPERKDDSQIKNQINRAVSSGIIRQCNGIVKEGREAVVYHADQGPEATFQHDVAIKVYRKVQEFQRLQGQEPTPEQLEQWAENEYRNLIRASRNRVPVPSPLHQKENLVFMKFMGEHGWPAPQLKDVGAPKGSKKWNTLYSQIMVAMRRLYINASLVHGDLNEYNIMVCPASMVENCDSRAPNDPDAVQAVLIDFGQAVDVRDPNAEALLERDVNRIKDFFTSKDVRTLGTKTAMEFVMTPEKESGETTELRRKPSDGLSYEQLHPSRRGEGLHSTSLTSSSRNSSRSSSIGGRSTRRSGGSTSSSNWDPFPDTIETGPVNWNKEWNEDVDNMKRK